MNTSKPLDHLASFRKFAQTLYLLMQLENACTRGSHWHRLKIKKYTKTFLTASTWLLSILPGIEIIIFQCGLAKLSKMSKMLKWGLLIKQPAPRPSKVLLLLQWINCRQERIVSINPSQILARACGTTRFSSIFHLPPIRATNKFRPNFSSGKINCQKYYKSFLALKNFSPHC